MICKSYELSKDIFLVETSLKNEDCKKIIEIFSEQQWQEANTLGNVENYRKTKVQYISQLPRQFDPKLTWAHNQVAQAMVEAMFEVKKHYLFNEKEGHFNYSADEGFQLLKYEPGCFYKEHVDDGANLQRRMSTVLYLNDGFEGGETEFPRQNFVASPKTGCVLVFPSTYTHPHIAKEIKSGEKYTVVTWWR